MPRCWQAGYRGSSELATGIKWHVMVVATAARRRGRGEKSTILSSSVRIKEGWKIKGPSCVQGQDDSLMSGEESGGGVMLFLHGTPLVMTSMCVSG